MKTKLRNNYPHFFSHCKQSSRKVTITSALTVPTQSCVHIPALLCVERSEPFRNCGHRDRQTDGRTVPGSAHSLRSRGNNSQLSIGLWQERSRLRASIPETFPLFPPSFLQILHPLPHPPLSQLPCSSLPFNITSSLCLVSRRSKSQGFSSREEGCYGAWFLEGGKKWWIVQGGFGQGPLCAAPVSSKVRGQVDGSVGGEEQFRMSFTVGQQPVVVSQFIFHFCVISGGRDNPQELHLAGHRSLT